MLCPLSLCVTEMGEALLDTLLVLCHAVVVCCLGWNMICVPLFSQSSQVPALALCALISETGEGLLDALLVLCHAVVECCICWNAICVPVFPQSS